MAITSRSTSARGPRRWSVVATVGALVAFTACAEDEQAELPLVVVPNEVLADLVERVACVEPVQTTIAPDSDTDEPPVLVVTLDEPSGGAVLTVSVPAAT